MNKNLQKSIKEGKQDYDKITNRNSQLVSDLVNSNQVDSSIVTTVSNLPNDKKKSQFSLEPVEGDPNLFKINPTNSQEVIIKGLTLTYQNCNTNNSYDPDLQYFITKTQFDREIQNVGLIYTRLNNMQYNINIPGDQKSDRYNFIEALFQPQKGSVFNQYIFFPSDPDELVDQLKLIMLEKVGGKDNPQLNGQIVAITEKLLEYQCITTNQHQNLQSTFGIISACEAPTVFR